MRRPLASLVAKPLLDVATRVRPLTRRHQLTTLYFRRAAASQQCITMTEMIADIGDMTSYFDA